MVPPGRSTRANSVIAATSSGMCSSTSDAIDAVEGRVGKGQCQRIPLHRGGRMVGRQFARLHHRPQGAAHLGHFVGPGVERDDGRAAPCRLERVTAESTTEVQEAVTRLHPELVVVHCQHATSPPGATTAACVRVRTRGAPGNGSPASRAR